MRCINLRFTYVLTYRVSNGMINVAHSVNPDTCCLREKHAERMNSGHRKPYGLNPGPARLMFSLHSTCGTTTIFYIFLYIGNICGGWLAYVGMQNTDIGLGPLNKCPVCPITF